MLLSMNLYSQGCGPGPHFIDACLAPPNSALITQDQIDYALGPIYDPGTMTVTTPTTYKFSTCASLPTVVGTFYILTYSATFQGNLVINNGTPTSITAPSNATVMVVLLQDNAGLKTYETEMLQMEIMGGNLPAGIMIRESPIHASTGTLTVLQKFRLTEAAAGMLRADRRISYCTAPIAFLPYRNGD